MNKILLLILIVVVGGGAFLLFQDNPPKEEQGETPTKSTLEMLTANSGTETALLAGVEENEGSGTAYRSFADGKFLHAVVAEMAQPAQGNVYEGWLVQPDPLQFFSTGVMEQNEQGEWQLEYTGSSDYPSYSKVIITSETVVDETPEAHILEGDF